MKLFSCGACQQVVFFENVSCTRCGEALAYLPDRAQVGSLDGYRRCANFQHDACNWAVPADSPDELCRACRFNDVIPDLGDPQAKSAWQRVERAKRRLLYTLLGLGLPLERRGTAERGLAFAFKQDAGATRVLTGHDDGLITLNIAEADDPYRERTRLQMGEAYRTLLGHLRHESGHYYWLRLIPGSRWEAPCRDKFGDERADYAAALERHYRQGAPADWAERFVSAYASMHPAEDWAETWAHYLHIVDTLETSRSYGLALRPQAEGGGDLAEVRARRLHFDDFEDLITAWVPLTLALNSLNRSMGLADLYPFILTPPAIGKLRLVHDVIEAYGRTGRRPGPGSV